MVPMLSKALNIPLRSAPTQGEKENELGDLKNLLEPLYIDGVISGAIASEYQRTRIEQVCYNLNLKSFTPLWHKNQQQLLTEQVTAGFIIMIVGVFAEGLDKTWLGTILTPSTLHKLSEITNKNKINPAGEGGEFETITLDGPIYNKTISIDSHQINWKRDHGYLLIKKAHLDD